MELEEKINNYWFAIEPYVFVGFSDKEVVLYNTLDKQIVESNKLEVVELMRETLQKENCGVLFLSYERYNHLDIRQFIFQLREKFMGDIIEVGLSNGKPIQLLPYYDFITKGVNPKNIYLSDNKNVLENLSEISIHVDSNISDRLLILILRSIPNIMVFNVVGDWNDILNHEDLLFFLVNHSSNKYIICSYKNLTHLRIDLNNFKFKVSVHLPIEINEWNKSIDILYNHSLDVEYIFDVSSEEDCLKVELLTEKYKIEKFQLNPIYTGDNILFFKKHIYLSKEDILSASISIRDFYIRQSMNAYDFGKINIMSNGDVYANVDHPKLGNIYMNSIYDLVQKEIEEGLSWFRIRDQSPCDTCIYQWYCPSPSKYEIAIGYSNLCHVKPNSKKYE